MRTTVDLPGDLHQQLRAIAHDTHRTLSETVADLLRRGLDQGRAGEVSRSAKTGLPVVRIGTVVTSEDVRSLADSSADSSADSLADEE
ncbi:antitoxin [Mycobacterium sp.]|uniref:antitoxin n=1 Tax=Mycobacterium sp. TaxID=1785 RepID=UPI0012853B8D|nr:antitoxin [Mycobacterium sp.]KAA8963527.1 MAG: antitoxin [Mycobacterium sp.]